MKSYHAMAMAMMMAIGGKGTIRMPAEPNDFTHHTKPEDCVDKKPFISKAKQKKMNGSKKSRKERKGKK